MKVLITITTYDAMQYCVEEFKQRISDIIKNSKIQCNVLVIDNSEKPCGHYNNTNWKVITESREGSRADILVRSQDRARLEFLKTDATHMLNIESDVIPPLDVVDKLIENNVDIVTGVYFNKRIVSDYGFSPGKGKVYNQNQIIQIHAKKLIDPGFIEKNYDDTLGMWYNEKADSIDFEFMELMPSDKRLIPIRYSGVGCFMVSRKAAELSKFQNSKIKLGDEMFCRVARHAGLKCWLDTSVWCKHLHRNSSSLKEWITDATQGIYEWEPLLMIEHLVLLQDIFNKADISMTDMKTYEELKTRMFDGIFKTIETRGELTAKNGKKITMKGGKLKWQ